MKTAIVTFVASLNMAVPSMGGDRFVPLTELSGHTLDDMLYIMKRCAALSLVVDKKMTGDGGYEGQYLAFYNRFMEVAFNATVEIAKSKGRAPSATEIDLITSDVEDMILEYTAEMNENYIASGNQVSQFITDETSSCIYIKQTVLDRK